MNTGVALHGVSWLRLATMNLMLFTLGGMWCQTAQAQDTATFNVSGNLRADCGFVSTDISFPLGDVPLTDLAQAGAASAFVSASLQSAGCYGATWVYMSFDSPADDNNPLLFKTSGAGRGAGIELRSADDNVAVPDGLYRMRWAPRAAGGRYGFKARYVANGAGPVAGAANAQITVRIEYE